MMDPAVSCTSGGICVFRSGWAPAAQKLGTAVALRPCFLRWREARLQWVGRGCPKLEIQQRPGARDRTLLLWKAMLFNWSLYTPCVLHMEDFLEVHLN